MKVFIDFIFQKRCLLGNTKGADTHANISKYLRHDHAMPGLLFIAEKSFFKMKFLFKL